MSIQALFADVEFLKRIARRTWESAVKCSMMNRGTKYAGMSTKGNFGNLFRSCGVYSSG